MLTMGIYVVCFRRACHLVNDRPRGSVSAPGAPWAFFFYHSPPVPLFAPSSPNNLEYLLAVSKNLTHPLHPVYDDGKGGGWKWWE